MFKTALSFCLCGITLVLTACVPTATIVGESNTPIDYTYTPGFSPPQVMYSAPSDADLTIESAAAIQQEKAINTMNDSIAAAQKQKEAAQQQMIQQELNLIPQF